MANLAYKRLLLKLSGEQLAGEFDAGIDAKTMVWIANELKAAVAIGAEIVVMVGGGNFIRGAQVTGNGIARVTADHMGMLGTLINGLALADVFSSEDLDSRVLTSVKADQVADQYTQRRAISHLRKGRVVIVAGGVGRPYLTTDTAAVNLALELDCDIVCKTTKVDGVYDKDPALAGAQRYEQLSFQEAIENPAIKVMDKAALGLAMEQHKPILVFGLQPSGSISRAAEGEHIGTLIH